ncbi:MAG TPA: BrnA antitoxin family protein [Alphaproteobacteria bacterium]|nr:BrnA antitoxin family protein [Alphaproteobacteria bacterium]
MKKKPKKPKNISQQDWDAVDVPEWTKEDFKRARPAREVFPEIVEAYLRTRSTKPENNKVPISIRLSRDVLAHFKATGTGWQTRLDNALRLIIGK